MQTRANIYIFSFGDGLPNRRLSMNTVLELLRANNSWTRKEEEISQSEENDASFRFFKSIALPCCDLTPSQDYYHPSRIFNPFATLFVSSWKNCVTSRESIIQTVYRKTMRKLG